MGGIDWEVEMGGSNEEEEERLVGWGRRRMRREGSGEVGAIEEEEEEATEEMGSNCFQAVWRPRQLSALSSGRLGSLSIFFFLK